MKKTIIYIISILVMNNMTKASDTLLLVSGISYRLEERIEEITQRPVIFTYNESMKSIDTIMALNSEFMNITFINMYNRYGYLTMLEEKYADTTYFSFINLNKINPYQKIKLNGRSIESNLVIFDTANIFYCIELSIFRKILGINEKMVQEELTVEDYNNVYIQGEVGNPVNNTEFLLLYNEITNNNALHIAKGFGRKVGPIFYQQPPKDMYNSYSPALKSVRINDAHCMVILYDYSRPQKDKIGEKYFLIYDKHIQEWYKHTVKGNATSIRSYDNGWVAGTIRDKDKGRYYDKTTARSTNEEYDFKRESPGYEERDPMFYTRTDGVWGDCFDERIMSDGLYYPGLLYLFNVHTKDYIEWDTKQGDSEVLLVQDDMVYYRVNTKILKSAIIDNQKLSEPELLIDDARVRDIHWAYLKKEK
jgi:hypothetical protein